MAQRAIHRAARAVRAPVVAQALRVWAMSVTSPGGVMRSLPTSGPPVVGAAAVLTRFVVTDLVETLPQALLGRQPFRPTKLPVAPENHYRAQALYLPAFGLAQWLLMGAAAQAVLRLTGSRPEISRVLDVIGVGMLVPMPALWMSDTLMLATGSYRLPGLAVTHSCVQLWETALFGLGLRAAGETDWRPAAVAGIAASAVYVTGGASVVR